MTETEKTCHHVFVGKHDGVHCKLCGLHLTPQQYHDLLHPPEKPHESEKSEAKKEAAPAEKSEQAATEAPQAKPKRTRKKKEK